MSTTRARFTLLETPESVFEVLWGATLVYFIIRTALLYSAVIIATGFISRITVASVLRLSKAPFAEETGVFVLAVHVILLALLARPTMVTWGVPRSASFRLAVGAVAYFLLLGVEMLGGDGVYGDGYGAWGVVGETAGRLSRLVLVAFALQPVIEMMFEKKPGDELEHARMVENEKRHEAEFTHGHPGENEKSRESEFIHGRLGENEKWLHR